MHHSRSWVRSLMLGIFLLLQYGLACLVPRSAAAQVEELPIPSHLLEDERNTIEIFRGMSHAVVFITTQELRYDFYMNVMEIPKGTGSGFVWDDQGHIVTNFHVIQGRNSRITVTTFDGEVYDAELVGQEPRKDIAVLKIKPIHTKLQAVQPGDSGALIVGQKVLAIGNPFGLDHTLTTGIISALGREIRSVTNLPIQDVIQTDAAINPGNSGGPLLDSSGQLIGINTAIVSSSRSSAGIGFAVPVNTIRNIVPQLITKGYVSRAGLGITTWSDSQARQWGVQGVVIRTVRRNGAAGRSKLRPSTMDRRGRVRLGDIIIGINEQHIHKYDDLYQSLENKNPGDTIRVRFIRDKRERSVKLRLQELGN